jgi:hypothetical protein
MPIPDNSCLVTINSLNEEIALLKSQLGDALSNSQRNYEHYEKLQNSVRYFFESNNNEGTFEFDIDNVNAFLAENSIEPLKREYRVEFRIEGTIIVEAESEDEARDIVDELDVSHWSSEIEHFEAEATNVEATF